MNKEYKIFSEQYNKILDLVEMVDEELADKYEKVINRLPEDVIDELIKKNLFVHDEKYTRVVLDMCEDQLCLEHTKYDNYLCTTVCLQPFYEDEIIDYNDDSQEVDIDGLFMFSLAFVNTEDEPSLRFNYVEKYKKYSLVSAELGIELEYEVFLKRENGKFFLISNKMLNQMEIYSKKVPVDYKVLIDCVNCEGNEDDYSNEI